MKTIRIGLIGDYNPDVIAHQAIPVALSLAATTIGFEVVPEWLGTAEIEGYLSDIRSRYHGLWCVPNCPYQSESGALAAIRLARENDIPYLGSCGGFQHAVLEYSRNVLGWDDAGHLESDPETRRPVISLLSCSMVEKSGKICLEQGSIIARAYGGTEITETYHCRYGLNPQFAAELLSGELRFTGRDESGDVRSLEIPSKRFFVATLFQPERAGLRGEAPPLVREFLRAASA